MDVSVIICTYNRADWLFRTLRSLQIQETGPGISWEVIVVDNNSSDRTPEVVARASQDASVPVKYITEERQGKSFALNTGIEVSKGEILAFTDDDVVVDSGWVRAMWKASKTCDVIGFGGRTLPLWLCRKPNWIITEGRFANAFGKVGIHNLGDEPLDYAKSRFLVPAGANMFFRKTAFAEYGWFREDLGMFGKKRIGQVDTEFCARLIRNGEKLFYIPEALVWHAEQENHLTKRYFRSWHIRHGRTAVASQGVPARCVRYFGIPRYAIRNAITNAARWAWYMVTMRPNASFVFQLRAMTDLGFSWEHFKRRLEKRKKRTH